MTKKWYHSKTEIGALIAAVALIIQLVTGNQWLDPTIQTAIVVVYFAVIRLITNKGLEK